LSITFTNLNSEATNPEAFWQPNKKRLCSYWTAPDYFYIIPIYGNLTYKRSL